MEEVYSHCRKLYQRDPMLDQFDEVRDEVISLITKTFLDKDMRF